MLRNVHWQTTDILARAQFAVFQAAGNTARLTDAQRRQALRLSHEDWAAWSNFLCRGPLPASPPLPEMLCRLAMTSHRLFAEAERIGIAA